MLGKNSNILITKVYFYLKNIMVICKMSSEEDIVKVNIPESEKFILTDEEFNDLLDQIEHRKIDIKKTIENTAAGDLLGVKYAHASPLSNRDDFPEEIPELLDNGKTYDNKLDDEFLERALKCVEEDHGLYISLVYAMDESGPVDISFKKVNEDDDEDYGNTILIEASNDGALCYFDDAYEVSADMTSDYGINIRKVNDTYRTTIGVRSAGLHCWNPQDFSEGWADEPMDQIILKLIYDAIVFED